MKTEWEIKADGKWYRIDIEYEIEHPVDGDSTTPPVTGYAVITGFNAKEVIGRDLTEAEVLGIEIMIYKDYCYDEMMRW